MANRWGKNGESERFYFLELKITADGECSHEFIKKLEIELPYDPAIPLLGIYTKETRIERDTWTSMFTTALFTLART